MNKAISKWKVLPKLALTGVTKNGAVYYPYFAAGIFSVFTFFIFSSILCNDIVQILPKSQYALMLLLIGKVLLGIILLLFLIYTNSFLIKRRKREIGLYSILGLEKRHIGIMIFVETLISYVVVLVGGIISGTVFAKLLFMLLLKMSGLTIDVRFVFEPAAFTETAVYFLAVYAVNLVYNLCEIGRSKPVELMSGSKKGEKEPRFLWIYAVAGILVLGWGYKIALASGLDSMIFINFFLAVLLVVIGTYFLFTSGSVALLKLLKKSKKVYYKSSNFITISGMLYRMKKNAASLVNICVFSTMVIITMLCTLSLYLGMKDVVYFNNLYDGSLYFESTQIEEEAIISGVEHAAKNNSLEIEELVAYDRIKLSCGKTDNSFGVKFEDQDMRLNNYKVIIMTLDKYNKIEKNNLTLESNQAYIFSSGPDFGYDKVEFMGKELTIKGELKELCIAVKSDKNTWFNEFYLIVKDFDAYAECVGAWGEANGVEDMDAFINSGYHVVEFNVRDKADTSVFMNELKLWSEAQKGYVEFDDGIDGRETNRAMYGGLLFIGVIFGMVFLMCLLLIMYYKQIAEGYEDREGFSIMQKVGMSDKEIKGTIGRQILLVFFLPLAGAILHTIVGLSMVKGLFTAINFFNDDLIIACGIGVILIFTLFYGISYIVTAKTYYGIVKQGEH